ncbi:L-tryptophan--pyruvate aminotransferase, partial [Sarracenia purpurea var. burkii]
MNTSQFMDKQIMDLSNSQNNKDFIDLMNPQEDHIGSGKQEEIVPSYDFQPIRPTAASQQSNLDSQGVGGTRVWNSADSKTNTTGIGTGIKNYNSLNSSDPTKISLEKDHNANNAAFVAEIDRTMKKHSDNILHALEGLSARISQLESRAHVLENSMDDLKLSAGSNHESTDGQLRQLEKIIQEVQAGVQVIRDKQDIIEGQLHLSKMQVSKIGPESEAQNTLRSDNLQYAVPAPQQSHQNLPPAIIQPPTLSPPNAPPTATQIPNQFPPNQIPSVPQREAYFPPPGQAQEATNQQYQLPPPQQLQPPLPTPPQQQYQPPPHSQYSQPPPAQLPSQQQQYQPPLHPQYSQAPPPQQNPSLSPVNPQPQPSLGHYHEEATYVPPPTYPPSGNPTSQQLYAAPSHMYEPPFNKLSSGFPSAYGSSSGTHEPYSHSGSTSQYGGGGGGGGGGTPSQYSGGPGGSMKQQFLSSAAQGGGGSVYPQLPTARTLPHALPTAAGVGGGSGPTGSGNKVPIDDVVDKLTTMGFTRDQVRATVRKLTENGQSVDLNVVLDKLMNDGEGGQPQK